MQQKPTGFRGDWLTPDNPRFKEVVYDGACIVCDI